MSWQATTWAQEQKTGRPATKLLLMVLANYADANGQCWPSQKTLAAACEISVDAVQRHSRKLEQLGLLARVKTQRLGGQWAGWHYQLNVPWALGTEPQIAARSRARRVLKTVDHQAANSPVTGPQTERSPGRSRCGMNSNRTVKNSNSTATSTSNDLASRAPTIGQARRTRRDIQDLQRNVVSKLGNGNAEEGWLIFGSLETWRRKHVENLEAEGGLTREIVAEIRAARCAIPGGPSNSGGVTAGPAVKPSNAKS